MRPTDDLPRPRGREYLPTSFKMTDWSRLRPYYEALLKRDINNADELERWLLDRSELEAFVSEAFAWRYINISRDSADENAQIAYQYAIQELSPRILSYHNKLDQKLVQCEHASALDQQAFGVHLRQARNAALIFRESNIPLHTDVQLKSKQHGKIFSEMTIGLNGMQMTLQKAGTLLEEKDRNRREEVYHKINQRIQQDTQPLETLFDELLEKRHGMARNAGFDNFRDYHFRVLGRFDYNVEDCEDFHQSIADEIVPLVDHLNTYRREKLGLDSLRPWDLHVDTSGQPPLHPFDGTEDLLDRSEICLARLSPEFSEVLSIMRSMDHLDLESRKGKRPGGYNMPLLMTGVPFIFMNATRTIGDVRTLLHESGHAIHAYLMRDLRLSTDRRLPSEVSELAAMSMELLTLDHWDTFFDSEEDLRRARIHQLENVLKVLPWIATIDKFQHWIYTHPQHNSEERRQAWLTIYQDFAGHTVDYDGLELYSSSLWHKQLHLFEAPFYYIEYGMAQLGAIAIWQRYRQNPTQAVADYTAALKLGYSRPITEIYQRAGIEFNFSRKYVRELGDFVKKELEKLLV